MPSTQLHKKLANGMTTRSLLVHIGVPLLLIILVVGFQFNQLQDVRQQHLQRSQFYAQDVGATLASNISGSIQNIDLTLLAASDHIQNARTATKSDDNQSNHTFHDLQMRVPAVLRLQAVNANGDVIFGSDKAKLSNENIANQDYFKKLKTTRYPQMLISEPMQDKDSGKWILICARRLSIGNGEFGGVIMAAVAVDGILNWSNDGQSMLEAEDTLMLRDDLHHVVVLYGNGKQDNALIGSLYTSPYLDELEANKTDSGSFVDTSSIDQIKRSYYYQKIAGRPLNVVVGISFKAALNEWVQESRRAWIVTSFLLLLIVGSAYLVFRSNQRNMRAFSALQSAQSKLETMNQDLAQLSTTDSLTGLANRRKFEEVIAHEWSRAQRKKEPLAVAMVDIDFFKIYNDLYGHQAGDLCLKIVAKTLAAGLRDGSDFVARYGGEEFIVLLPGQGAEGTYEVLERLRHDVANKKLKHSGSKNFSILTFSAGFAVTIPDQGKTIRDLIAQADQYLYQAKRSGRNQVVGCDENGQIILSV